MWLLHIKMHLQLMAGFLVKLHILENLRVGNSSSDVPLCTLQKKLTVTDHELVQMWKLYSVYVEWC